MMVSASSEGDRTGELVLKGALVAQRAAELKGELQRALAEVDTLTVNLMETSEMDLSCLQLLCSAHRAAMALNKTLIRIGGSGVRGIGITDAPDCPFASDQDCIWSGGWRPSRVNGLEDRPLFDHEV